MKIISAYDVATYRLCLGCGACFYICPKNKIELFDIVDNGIRPFLNSEDCGDCRECINVCPGLETVHNHVISESALIAELREEFGPVLEIWEGYAAAGDIRYQGSSGGLASALALYCLEKEGMHGVLHLRANSQHPWKNETVLSPNRKLSSPYTLPTAQSFGERTCAGGSLGVFPAKEIMGLLMGHALKLNRYGA